MEANEVLVDVSLVRTLVESQFPHLRLLPIVGCESGGTDHALFRLGDAMVVRFPRRLSAVGQIEKELFWLPKLAQQLINTFIEIPLPLAKGEPDASFLWRWGIYRWIDGETATTAHIADPQQMANDLARFAVSLRNTPYDGTPIAPDGMMRGEPLTVRDAITRESIHALRDEIDVAAALAAWEQALAAPLWRDAPQWLHGDLLPGNLLVRNGRLCAVIDFGAARVGDPAIDAMPAWTNFTHDARATFRRAIDFDDATWNRARGWALSWAVVALAYYRRSSCPLSQIARRAIQEVLSENCIRSK
jgi:aminoglycoside phosphotransferase (APT) family kinase protein